MIRNKEVTEAKKIIKEEIAKINAFQCPYTKYENGCDVTYTDDMSKRTNSDGKKRLQETCNAMIHYYRDLYKDACDKSNSEKAINILNKYKK